MKPILILIFSLVFAIYFLANWYIFSRGLKALEFSSFTRLFTWVFWIMVVSFPIGQFLERANPNSFFRIISLIGSFYLVILLYSLLFVAFIDIIRLFDGWFGFIPQVLKNGLFSGKGLFLIVSSSTILLLIIGNINALSPVVRNHEIQIDKKVENRKEIKIVLVTDIHMGTIIQNNRIEKMVKKINDLDPDIILFAGDLVDHNPKPVIEKQMGETFTKLNPKLGIYAVTGNHEFIGQADVSIDYLSQFGITYVRDTAINIENILTLAGRDDKDKPRFEDGSNRKALDVILNNINPELPLILMDHQPVEYQQAEDSGVDLMVSGHTHKGQMWPFGSITAAVYENDYGLIKKGKTYFYTSSGFGTWGPPVRIGTRSEIVEITIKLK